MAEGDSELESGYTGNTAPVATQDAPQPELEKVAEPQEVQQEEAKPDPMQELRDFIAKQNELIEKQGQRLRNAEGHIGGLNHTQKQLQETLAAAKAASQKVAEAPTQAQVDDAIESPDEWKALKADFPDWAAATEKYMDARMRKLPAVDVDGLQKRVAEQIKGETDAVRREIIESSLEAVFPDWKTEINSPEFAEWRSKQPPEIEALASSPKVGDAARMLNLFAQSKAVKPTQPPAQAAIRQKRIEAAITPKGTGGYAPSRSEMDEFESGYATR